VYMLRVVVWASVGLTMQKHSIKLDRGSKMGVRRCFCLRLQFTA
jgi:hypothetical protein